MLGCFFYSYALIRNIAGPALHAIVHADMAGRAEGFVIVGGHAERRAHFFIETAQIRKLIYVHGQFFRIVGE